MKVKIKKLVSNAVVPKYAKEGDAALDLTATSIEPSMDQIVYGTGLAVEIPKGHVGLLFPRSSVVKTELSLANSVGVIDSGYRGEIKFVFNLKRPHGTPVYSVGERIGQLIILPYPNIEFEEVKELSDTERGFGGFGSTGK